MVDTDELVDRIHTSPYQGVIAVTGCSSAIVDILLGRGGGSKTLLDARVPYSTRALTSFIGHTPKKFCSDLVAKELASSSYSLATELREQEETPVFGLGITATLRKKGPEREGRIHQVFISFQTSAFTFSHHIVLNPKRNREQQDFLVALLALDTINQHLGDWAGTVSDDDIIDETVSKLQHPEDLQNLLTGKISCYAPHLKKDWNRENRIIIPGSFNPFHEGHRKMGEAAISDSPHENPEPLYEISISNADKGKLSGFEVQKRLNALADLGIENVVVTDHPTFLEKASLFPGATFVIGADTWYRIIDRKYYDHSEEKCEEALEAIRKQGCKFLVLCRYVNGHYHTLPTDKTTRGLARGLSEEQFKVDISSTQLRA